MNNQVVSVALLDTNPDRFSIVRILGSTPSTVTLDIDGTVRTYRCTMEDQGIAYIRGYLDLRRSATCKN